MPPLSSTRHTDRAWGWCVQCQGEGSRELAWVALAAGIGHGVMARCDMHMTHGHGPVLSFHVHVNRGVMVVGEGAYSCTTSTAVQASP